MTTSTSRSARSTATAMSCLRYPRRSASWSRSHMRVSVATWSLRLRPVWSLPATGPMSSPSLRSFAVWMSSSPDFTSKASAAHSSATLPRPATSWSRSVVGDDARLRERRGVALAAADVLLRHPAVEGQGLVELLHQRVDVLARIARPRASSSRPSPREPRTPWRRRRDPGRGSSPRDDRTLGDALERGGREEARRTRRARATRHRYVECGGRLRAGSGACGAALPVRASLAGVTPGVPRARLQPIRA